MEWRNFFSRGTNTPPAPAPETRVVAVSGRVPRVRRVPAQRSFSAAKVDRLTSSWTGTHASIDALLRHQLPRLRMRSRDLCRNNDYAKKFLQMCETNVVGPNGFTLQVKVQEKDAKGGIKLDKMASAAIEEALWKWARPENCDVTGKRSFIDICRLFIRTAAKDGEPLIRKVYGANAGPFGFQLQVLAIDRLDTDYNEILSGGRFIRMGVEVNSFGKPLAYWIRNRHPGDNGSEPYANDLRTRVPAEDIYHKFISDEPEQTRGVPWMHAAMQRLNNLGAYEEAAVIAGRVGASKMGFFTTPEGDTREMASDVETDADGNEEFLSEVDPGVFGVLPDGYKFESFNPDYPHAMYQPFVKATLRGIASGLGVSYNTLGNDLEGVNFSSMRGGVLEERECWMMIQNWMIESFLDDLFSSWLHFALLKGAIKLPNGSALPSSNYDKFNAATWQGRRWQWVDPTKDQQANVLAIENNLKSRSEVIREQGRDPDQVFEELAKEKAVLEKLGLYKAPAKPGQPAADDADEGGDEDKNKKKEEADA